MQVRSTLKTRKSRSILKRKLNKEMPFLKGYKCLTIGPNPYMDGRVLEVPYLHKGLLTINGFYRR